MSPSRFLAIVVAVLTSTGCKGRCDPDEIFEEQILGSDWLECGDLSSEADRAEATACLEEALESGIPAHVRVSGDGGVLYLYIDDELRAGVLTWGGRRGRMGDVVYHFHPCDPETAIDAFANYEQQIYLECSLTVVQLCP